MAQKSLKKLYPKIQGDANFGFNRISFIKSDTRQTAGVTEGQVEYDDSDGTLCVYNGTSWVNLGAATTATTGLDGNYDINYSINVDNNPVTLTGTAAGTVLLANTTQDQNVATFTKTGAGAGSVVTINNSGSGVDITGTSATWTISKAGAIVATDLTLTASTVSVTGDATSGTIATIVADTLTTGKGLLISMATASSAELLKVTVGATALFLVEDSGAVTIAGVADGTDALTLTAGDIKLTDGNVTCTAGDVNITAGLYTQVSDASADGFTITDATSGNYDLMYINGTTNAGTGSIIKVFQGAATRTGPMIDLDMGTTAVAMEAIDIDCTGGTRTYPIISVNSDGTASDFIYLTNGVVFTGNYVNMKQSAGAATGNFMFLNNDSGTGLTAINIDDDASLVDTILCTTSAAIGAAKAVFHVVSTGTPNATGNAILVNWSGVTATNTPYMVNLDSNSKDIAALIIDSDAATDDVMQITNGGALANDKAILDLVWDGTPANAGSNMIRLDVSGATCTSKPVLFEVVGAGKTVQAISVDADPTDKAVVLIHSSGANTDGIGVLSVTSDGAIAAGGNLVNVTYTGTPADQTVAAVEIVSATNNMALDIASSAVASNCVRITGSGALTDNLAVLNVASAAALAAGGNVLRVAYTGTPAGVSVATMEIASATNNMALDIASSAVGANCVRIIGSGALTNGLAVLSLSSAAALATGGNILNVTYTGTPAAAAVSAFDLVVSQDCYAMDVVTSAAAVSAIRVTGVGALADDKSLLELVHNTGTAANGSSVISITASTAATATAYGLDINCSGANFEAIWVEAGTVKFAETLEVTGATTLTGAVTCTAGVQSLAVARTATATGATTGTIAAGTAYVTVTAGSDADCIIILPAPIVGNSIWLYVGATGYELRSSTPASIAINGGTGSAAESAVAASQTVHCTCTSATTWIATNYAADGTESKLEAAAN